jgi:hypothetical protein
MTVTYKMIGASVLAGVLLMAPAAPSGQAAVETFTATATAKGAGGAAASAPVTIAIERKTPEAEATKLIEAFKAGGAAALRKALVGIPPTGSVKIGAGTAVPTRVTIERVTGAGRLLTIVTDRPLLFVGAGLPGAKPKEGYDFAVIDLEIGANGEGDGMFAPAAKIKLNGSAFVVEDYGVESVRLTAVKKGK